MATASPLKFPEALKASGIPAPTSEAVQQLLSARTRHVDLEFGEDWTLAIKKKIEEITSKTLSLS